MAVFLYRAVAPDGKPHKGVIEASSEVAARGLLRDQKLLPLLVKPTTSSPLAPGEAPAPLLSTIGRGFRLGGRLRARSLATITRQLATLIGSDVRIEEALRLTARQAPNAAAGSLLLNVRGAILEGRSFADALGDHPSAFPGFYRASIAAGERSGRLSDVMDHLADYVENRQRGQQKIKLALLYPALLAAVSSLMMVLLLIYVVPNITRVFVSRGANLPLLTRALIGISSFLQHYGWLVLLTALVLLFLARRWTAVEANRLKIDHFFATRRPFSRVSRQINATRFAGSLATLVQSDVALVDALKTAAAVVPNLYIRQRALMVAARVREGTSLNQAMAEADVFPPMLVAVVASGESSGRLGRSLGKAAADMDREVEALASTMVALVEPAVLLLMGLIVLLMVLAILLPIIGLSALA